MGWSEDHDYTKFRGLGVAPRPNEDAERLIRRFQKKVRNDGILQEIYTRTGYDKPSVRRRRKASRARFIRACEEAAPKK